MFSTFRRKLSDISVFRLKFVEFPFAMPLSTSLIMMMLLLLKIWSPARGRHAAAVYAEPGDQRQRRLDSVALRSQG